MLSYTKATLKAALTSWNRNSAPEFETELDDIIMRGELDLVRAIDYDPLIGDNDTSTAASAAEVFKPSTLLHETELWVTVDGVRTPLLKRSRAWVKMCSQTPGTPKYYCELDTERWEVGPPALDAYLITVTGQYAPDSITDGDDDTTTYFSTKMPELLYLACAIQACEFLKFWGHKQALLQEFGAKVAILRGETPNQELTQGGDNVGDRITQNPMKPPGA
jgi:hypothetical protein